MTPDEKTLRLARQVQQKVNALRCADPVYAPLVIKAIADQMGVSTDSLLEREQLAEQSLAMHRMALSFNKHTNAEKANASYTDPSKVSQMRGQILELTEENIKLHQELLELRNAASSECDSIIERLKTEHQKEVDFLTRQIDLLSTKKSISGTNTSENEFSLAKTPHTEITKSKGKGSKRKSTELLQIDLNQITTNPKLLPGA